jgi:hypothetical protein
MYAWELGLFLSYPRRLGPGLGARRTAAIETDFVVAIGSSKISFKRGGPSPRARASVR